VTLNAINKQLLICRSCRLDFLMSVMSLFIFCAVNIPAFAESSQDITWVTIEASAPIVGNNTERARDIAIEMAEWKAIEQVTVANISMESLLVNLKLSGSMIGAIPYAEIVETEIIEEDSRHNVTVGTDVTSSMYRVKMKVGVLEKTSGFDPGFHIKVTLNQTRFKDGDEMQIHLKPTKDCFIFVFILLEDQKVIRLIPNQVRPNNFLESEVAYTIPNEEDRQKGRGLGVNTPQGKSVAKEAVYVIALRQPFDFENTNIQEGINGIYNGQTALVEELIRQIVTIPMEDRTEHLIPYQITKAQGDEPG